MRDDLVMFKHLYGQVSKKMPVTVNLSGEGIEFEREISEDAAIEIMQLSISDRRSNDEGTAEERDDSDVDAKTLPDDFFRRLSSKQRAMLTVLTEAKDPLTSTELRRRMDEEYDIETSGGRALAGILAGFTRKYGADFELVSIDWGDGEGLYQLNPNRPGYVEELESRLLD
ncbi:hypothetical protein [Haloplanus rubicundus]|nr:hypothetical protein [Haloplanus rubicundus]